MPADIASPAATSAAQRTAWLLFAPPAALMGLRWWLAWQVERGPQTPLQPLLPFVAESDPLALLGPVLWTVLALLAIVAGTLAAGRIWGWRRVRRAGALVWVALCVAGGGALLWRHWNLQGAQPLPPVQAQVLGSHFQPPSLRSTGGTLLVLRVAGLAQPQQVLIDDPQAAQWRAGQCVALQWARGRSSGLFVTGWQAHPAPASAQAGALLQ